MTGRLLAQGAAAIRWLPMIGLLIAAWCAMWGSVSAANVLSGGAVAVIAAGLGSRARWSRIRFGSLFRVGLVVLVDLVTSTVVLVREVLTPTDRTDEAIVGVAVPPVGHAHRVFLYIAISVTPGSAVVAESDDGRTLYVHLLHVARRRSVEEHVRRLSELIDRALPVVDAAPRTPATREVAT